MPPGRTFPSTGRRRQPGTLPSHSSSTTSYGPSDRARSRTAGDRRHVFAFRRGGVITLRCMVPRGAASPLIEVPSSEADGPSWRTIGIIAAVGFIVGVAWPRLAGVRIGPSLPDPVPSASSVAGASEPTPDAPAASAGGPSLSTQAAAPSGSARPASDDPRAPAGALAPAAIPAGYRAAQVEWAVAIVRDAPREGKV